MRGGLRAALFVLGTSPAAAELDVTSRSAVFPGPYDATLVRVIDGDTLDMRVAVWPGLIADYAVRVRGIDAPEIRRVGCAAERAGGLDAKAKIEALHGDGDTIRLENVSYDPFSGRVVADVLRWRGDRWRSLGEELVDSGAAVAWSPDQDDVPWCLLLQRDGN